MAGLETTAGGGELTALGEAIAAVATVRLDDLGPAELRSLVLGLEAARTRLEAVALAAIEVFDRNGDWAADGAYSTANWLQAHTGAARAVVGSRARLARHLATMPLTAEALAAAEITEPHARVLARGAQPRTRELFAEHEAHLVESARRLSADDLAKVMDRWLAFADPDGAEPRRERPDELHLSETLDGRIVGRFSFGRETGAALAEAVRSKTDELFHRDRRAHEADPTDPLADQAPATRRARALAELVEQAMAAGEGSRRQPSFTVVVRPGPAGDEHFETTGGSVVPPELAATWLCDSEVARLVMSAEGVPLELGRSVRTASAGQRRALWARDGGCAVPGCDRPPAWCDAHHVRWWDKGGSTDLANLALLCRHHHRRVHAGALEITMVDGLPRVLRADGTEVRHPRAGQRGRGAAA